MNSLKKSEGIPLLNFVGCPGVPLLNFEGGPGSQGPDVLDPRILVPRLHHAQVVKTKNWICWERKIK